MATASPWRVSVAPMMDWTDRHCRFFHRLLSRRARLYTEMVTTGALRHGSVSRHLRFHPAEHSVALQLGGSEPADLAYAAKLGEQWGYDEINLNCGCPSERVQRGAFGACLMLEPQTVADGVKAMRDVVSISVTVKHRIGVDDQASYGFVRDFVGRVSEAGCEVFVVHARAAWLRGLSPKQNREVPPLNYATVYQLKRDFPHLTVVLNGGVTDNNQIADHLQHVDGVMLGREAYYRPWLLTQWDSLFFDDAPDPPTRAAVEAAMVAYMALAHEQDGCPWYAIARHMLGLYHGQRGGRLWRQVWSNHKLKPLPPEQVQALAYQALARGAVAPAA